LLGVEYIKVRFGVWEEVHHKMAFWVGWFIGRFKNIFHVLQGTVIYLPLYIDIERYKIELETRG